MPPFRTSKSRFTPRVGGRRLGAVALLVIATTLAWASLPATTANSKPRPHLPPQGVYESCAPWSAVDCAQRLRTIARAGFRYVLNYAAWSGSQTQVLRYADAANAAGVKLIWPLNHRAWRDAAASATGSDLLETYGPLAQSCGCSRNDRILPFAIKLVRTHPATWGFYTGDELVPQEVPRVAALAARVRSVAPTSPHLYVARPGVANLAPFAGLSNLLGVDVYPVGSGDPNVASVASDTAGLARSHGKDSVLVLQAFSWSQYLADHPYLFPNRRRMVRMRDKAIKRGHPGLLLWYSFHDIMNSASPTKNWKALKSAAFAPLNKRSRHH